MAAAGAEVVGLKEFRGDLKAMDSQWPKELRKVHKQIADKATRYARANASGNGGVQAKAAGGIKGRATQSQASVSTGGGIGNVAFWGAKKHTGWYAAPQYAEGPAQHPKWIGNTWDVAEFGQGPYAINPALAVHLPELLDDYLDMIDELSHRAFPT